MHSQNTALSPSPKHMFWSSNLEVIHCLFRTLWDCNHKQSCKRACHQGRNKFLALISYNPGWSAVVNLRTWIHNSKPPLWAGTARSCSAMKTPEPFSSSHRGHTRRLAQAVRGCGTAPRAQCQEESCRLVGTCLHSWCCEGPRGWGENTSHPQLEGAFSIIAAWGCSKCSTSWLLGQHKNIFKIRFSVSFLRLFPPRSWSIPKKTLILLHWNTNEDWF